MNFWQSLEGRPKLDHIRIRGVDVRRGSRVRLCPFGGADIMDLALDGMQAIVQEIEQDYENRVYVAVTVDEDPGRDLGEQRKPGHRFFFRADEIEPVTDVDRKQASDE